MEHTATLLDAFSQLEDPRCRRGVRHPFAGIVVDIRLLALSC